MKRNLITASVLLLLSSSYTFAEGTYSAAYSACMAKAGGITSELSDCGGEELKKQNVRLNEAYKAAIARLSPDKKIQLRDVQRLWIKYRDANCGMLYSFTGGTMDMLNGAGCELSMTQERADALEWFAENGGE